ncbi:monovalent cation/H+ antiporter subunit A [Thiorhodococcus mannitoliphagus]|uniref:Monovalent cation/H+ antiporter subunit A n=1 Tax=Thiorhodococcus mannitoliphagus TaxID=329406 RepID=A0A6P1DWT2_9GAMM|nr:monovalent cation/H+ antiporter subunit A [Thiorhodococcus mannitoliphagus]NEX21451.1 monovalent cation/H+ antiporter subunit A [Thiorhodococcus mannitoliphagus]
MNLPLVILTPFIGAALTAWAARFGARRTAWVAGGMTLLALIILAPTLTAPFKGEVIIQRWSWIPQAGVDLAFRFDGLALLFTTMILGIGLLVILYARYYLSDDAQNPKPGMGRFYAYLLLFMGSMLGVVLSENLIVLLIFWEMTSLSSFLLISYSYQGKEARQGARMALTVTGLGGLALLGGFMLLGKMAGSYELSVILAQGDVIRADPLYTPMLVLILIGAFTKSAQFPFHFWLPRAMAAPTPVSAYLHSATLVKAGIFLLARLFPVLSGTPEWSWLVIGAGLSTLLIGAWFALFKHDLKGLLAYSTISHLGLITLLFGLATPLAAVAGLFHIINHATFKASLFMAAGIIDHECGTRDMRRINGLWKFMPYTATLAMVAAASMAGVPLFNGFLSKEMFFAETTDFFSDRPWGWMLPTLVALAGVLAVAYSLRFIHDVFFNGDPINLPKTPHEPPFWMKVPAEILVGICVLVGMFPAMTVAWPLKVAATSVLQAPPPRFDLAIWHGFNLPLLMSLIALFGGLLVYSARKPLFRQANRLEGVLDAGAYYDSIVRTVAGFATALTNALDRGSLQRLMVVFVVSVIAMGLAGALGSGSPLTGPRALLAADAVSVFIALALIVVTLATLILHHRRLTALVVVGALGLLVALIFVKFSAPDLALTQLSVEVVTIVLLLLALYFLPQRSPRESSRPRRIRDTVLALLAGGSAGALTWAMLTRPHESISSFFLENSVPGGGGTNVVNVILVDFRGYDTLGEISVLALAGLGIYAMLKDLELTGLARDARGRAWNWDAHPSIMAALTRLLLPLALLVSVFIFLRGHNQPGGGFIAGLITAVALIMQYLTNGVAWTHQRMSDNMHPLIGAGLLIATVTGLVSILLGYPFLTSTFTHIHWPVVGDFELASAMAFDLGVFLVVVGATLLILIHLGLMHDASHPDPKLQQEPR